MVKTSRDVSRLPLSPWMTAQFRHPGPRPSTTARCPLQESREPDQARDQPGTLREQGDKIKISSWSTRCL